MVSLNHDSLNFHLISYKREKERVMKQQLFVDIKKLLVMYEEQGDMVNWCNEPT